jgi:hypothetical protein
MKNVNVPIFFQQSSNFLHQGVARTTFCRINFDYMINYYRVDVQLNNFTLLTTIYSSPFLPTLSTTLLQKHYKYIPTNLTSMPRTHPAIPNDTSTSRHTSILTSSIRTLHLPFRFYRKLPTNQTHFSRQLCNNSICLFCLVVFFNIIHHMIHLVRQSTKIIIICNSPFRHNQIILWHTIVQKSFHRISLIHPIVSDEEITQQDLNEAIQGLGGPMTRARAKKAK